MRTDPAGPHITIKLGYRVNPLTGETEALTPEQEALSDKMLARAYAEAFALFRAEDAEHRRVTEHEE